MNIELIESNFIFSLYKDTDIFLDFISKVDPIKHFTNEESIFFFTMGRDLIKSGYSVIDQVAIETFLDTKPNLKSMYIKYGGWREVLTIMNIVEQKNVYKYWDEIIKLNMFRNLEKHGVVVDTAKFLNATSEEVYAFYEYILNDSMISNNKEVKIEKFYATDEYIDKLNEGLGMGAGIGSVAPRLNYDISGWHRGNLSILGSFSGNGKEQPVSEPILTENGWNIMGNIKIGDKVYGRNGKLSNVVGVFPQGIKDVYLVEFSDGTSTRCGLEHLWRVETPYQQARNKNKPNKKYDILNLATIMKDYKKPFIDKKTGNINFSRKYSIPINEPIEFAKSDVKLDPYILGLLLGDGGFKKSVTFTNSETELLEQIKIYFNNIGIDMSSRDFENHKQLRIQNKIIPILKEMKLYECGSREKFIPSNYIYNSIDNRRKLLSGLLNTDGSVTKGVSMYFSSYSKQLSKDTAELSRSLGFVVMEHSLDRTSCNSTQKYEKEIEYVLRIIGDFSTLSLLSKKHKNKMRYRKYGNYSKKIDNITLIGKEESQCIMVDDPEHLYITKDFIVTHNTSWCTAEVVLPLVEQGYQYTIISNEQVKEEFLNSVMVHILATKFKEFGITRKRLLVGKFSSSEILQLKKAQSYINEHIAPLLNFVKLFEYDIAETKKIIKKLSNEGCGYFLFDTFKAEDSADDNARGLMVEYSKELFQLASKLNVHILMTQQLAIYMENTRYLTSACLSASKQVKEVADVVILMRQSWDDELDGEKFDVKPYNYMKDSNGKYIKDDKGRNIKEYFTLSEDDRNMLVFLDKNRWGEDKKTYIYTFGGAWNVWKEKGYCHVHTKNRF